MSFESGSVSFRAFYVPRELPEDAVKRFAKYALPPLNTLGRGDLHGWVTGRHMLDRDITEETAIVSGYLRLCLAKVEKKIPEALMRAECKMRELSLMQAEGKPFVNRAERSKIRKEVESELLPNMPPLISGIPLVYDGNSRMMYAGATSDKRMDALLINFEAATAVGAAPVTMETAAKKRKKMDVAKFNSVSFSPEIEDEAASSHVGQDFLTWLWFFSEAKGGQLEIDGDTYAVGIEGPLTFFMEGGGAHMAVLRNGTPVVASEAKTSLLSGKKLLRAQVILARGKETWSTSFDARDFAFRGFKFPAPEEKLDAISMFQQRMLSLDRFTNAFLSFYDAFLEVRSEPAKWKPVQKDIHKWVKDRTAKN